MTTTCIDRLGDRVTDSYQLSELSLTKEDEEKIELLNNIIILDRASVNIEVVKVEKVEVAVENVVEIEEDF